jgi:hypothetical protein
MKTKVSKTKKIEEAPAIDPSFAPVVDAFARDRQVTYGGKGFGSAALKVNGKIFAMLSSKGAFGLKLPKDRVDELVRTGKGAYFDPGRGKLMKEWVVVARTTRQKSRIELAREAHRFIRDGKASA